MRKLGPQKEKLMARIKYNEDSKTEFIELAKEMGIGPAIRTLKYPSYATARTWFIERNEELPTIDSLMQKAAELKMFYTDKEKLFATQTLLDRIVETLQEKTLGADEINRLSNAMNKAIQTFNLIEGKATTVTENRTKDGTDLAITDMLNEAKAKSALRESELNK